RDLLGALETREALRAEPGEEERAVRRRKTGVAVRIVAITEDDHRFVVIAVDVAEPFLVRGGTPEDSPWGQPFALAVRVRVEDREGVRLEHSPLGFHLGRRERDEQIVLVEALERSCVGGIE